MAASINRVVLVGNLTRDPELRHTPGGTPVCSLRLAVNSRRKDESGQWVAVHGSEAALQGQIGKERQFHETGQRIFTVTLNAAGTFTFQAHDQTDQTTLT